MVIRENEDIHIVHICYIVQFIQKDMSSTYVGQHS